MPFYNSPHSLQTNGRFRQRKELSHTQLVNEVIQVLSGRFKPEMSLIKGQIESLISREYLERDELPDGSPADKYKYVA